MPLKITQQQQQAIANLENLAKLIRNDDSKDDAEIRVGLVKMADGRSRVFKFDAASMKNKPEMTQWCDALRAEVRKWVEAVNPEPLPTDEELLKNRCDFDNNSDIEKRWKSLYRTLLTKNHNVSDLRWTLESAFAQEYHQKFFDNSFRGGKLLSFEEIQKVSASKEFTYIPCKKSDAAIRVGNAVAKRSTFSNVLHAIGRGIMTATHALKAFFTGQVFGKAWGETINDYNDYKDLAGAVDGVKDDWKRPDVKAGIFEYDPRLIASSCGLSGEVIFRPFKAGEKLFPDGSPSISDIKQNPALQDCWFLSSLAALLRTQGPDYIKGLINTDLQHGYALVRLGEHQYQVRLGDVLAGGTQAVSDSKPWVRILEQAMAMHLYNVKQNTDLKAVGMSFRGTMEAFNALLGMEKDVANYNAPLGGGTNMADVGNAFANGTRPVVLASYGGVSGIPGSLGTGISPGHACAVIAVGKNHVTVLDPYGHIRQVLASDLKNFSMTFIGESTWNKHVGKESNNKVNAPVGDAGGNGNAGDQGKNVDVNTENNDIKEDVVDKGWDLL